ncbi:MAG: cyclic pyranopterin monophosphate synthase MoaC [Helicobacter sp.]|nr:cyclic pyranopterin monophosphate synthase MoaC [Helicobacter sp.]
MSSKTPTHIDINNNPMMVNITDKISSKRIAIASGEIHMNESAFEALKNDRTKKGAISQSSITAAILASKQTSNLIPLCHQIPLESVAITLDYDSKNLALILQAEVTTTHKTGVEMEALTAVSIGLLSVYDMLKAIDKNMQISNIKILKKLKSE